MTTKGRAIASLIAILLLVGCGSAADPGIEANEPVIRRHVELYCDGGSPSWLEQVTRDDYREYLAQVRTTDERGWGRLPADLRDEANYVIEEKSCA